QISISRVRLASYEDGRAPLRCDIALRACRQSFISEFWLACGAVNEEAAKNVRLSDFSDIDARLTMALAVHPPDISRPPDGSFLEDFASYWYPVYLILARDHCGFPRVCPV